MAAPASYAVPILPQAANQEMPLVLLVDDARVMRAVLQETLEKQGYHVLVAEDGEHALHILAQYPTRIDVMILDREMPGIDGIEVVRRMKRDPQFAAIPIIMFTATDMPEKIQEGIDAGVYYYLVKPARGQLLKSLIDSALRERRQKRSLTSELGRYGSALRMLQSCRMTVRTLSEAEDTACLIASCFPDPDRVVVGLMELFTNAIEHGHIGIAPEEKTMLLAGNRWREEIDRRALLPENAAKSVEITYQHKDGQYLAQITDSGSGFDWKRYWHINPARATAAHGRGIARARLMAFDRLSYNEKGNSVTVMVLPSAPMGVDYAW